MVDFGGWFMPVAYGSIIEEHNAVRERVGIFDVSHMGEFLVEGPGAKDFVNHIITNNCAKLGPGEVQYTVMCRQDGTVVDDLLVFVIDEDRIILVVNASNIDKDFAHVSTFPRDGVSLRNASADYALIAVQGPRSREVMIACPFFAPVRRQLEEVEYYQGFGFEVDGREVLVTRTGYTGELGFEVFVAPGNAVTLWKAISEAGRGAEIQPVGLGARDTLRFEASYCLYGHELDDATSPLEAGLAWVVKLKKQHGFEGQAALEREKAQGSRRKLVGLELEGRHIARQGYAVIKDGNEVGAITSGTFSPTLQKSLSMAMVKREAVEEGAVFEVQVRNRTVAARVTPLPFYPSRAK